MRARTLIACLTPSLVVSFACAQEPASPRDGPARAPVATPMVAAAAAPVGAPDDPAADKLAWPREFEQAGLTIRLYQPEIDRWADNRIESRAAVSVAKVGQATPTYGIITLTARTDVDKSSRMVMLRDIKVTSASFPQARADEAGYRAAIDQAIPDVAREVPLDHLEANLARTAAVKAADAVPVRNDPPKIIFADKPTLLILIDGEPSMQQYPNTQLMRVLNTRALILLDQATGTYYLNAGERWYAAKAVTGPWTPSAAAVPPSLGAIRDDLVKAGSVDAFVPNDPAAFPKEPPAIIVSTTPAELIQSAGEPQYSPIAGTGLLYLSNTDNPVFMLTQGHQVYVLVSGRWFRGPTLQGPWTFVPSRELPPDFARIPPDSPRANVLVSVPGTSQAGEAVIANSIPQTATVKVAEAKVEVTYDGDPKFKTIDGATDLEYATNSGFPVILVERPRTYWCVSNGVWFTSTSSLGPWAVATTVPAVIYTIPPSSPVHYVTYARVYGTAPGVVYVGYTPGYMGTCVSTDGVVVYGTGYYYPAYVSTTVWYGYPPTYGYGAGFACGAATGFAFGFAAGAMTGGCWGHPYWGPCWGYHDVDINTHSVYTNWRGGVTSVNRHFEYDASSGKSYGSGVARSFNPYSGRASVGGYSNYVNRDSGNFSAKAGGATYNPNTGVVRGGGREISGNMYDGNADVDRGGFRYNTRTNTGAAVGPNNIYAGHDGNVYKYDRDGGGWQHYSDGGWQDSQRSNTFSQQRSNLESQRSSRDVGQQRFNAARGGGHFAGRRR